LPDYEARRYGEPSRYLRNEDLIWVHGYIGLSVRDDSPICLA